MTDYLTVLKATLLALLMMLLFPVTLLWVKSAADLWGSTLVGIVEVEYNCLLLLRIWTCLKCTSLLDSMCGSIAICTRAPTFKRRECFVDKFVHGSLCSCLCVKLQGGSAQQEKYVQLTGTFRGLTQKAELSLLLGAIPVSLEVRKTLECEVQSRKSTLNPH